MTRQSSNKLEYSKRLASCYNSNSSCAVDIQPVDDTTIHQECNKKLRSRFYVNSNSKPKFNWNYNQPKSFGVYTFGNGSVWLCRDRKVNELSECEREQIRLYNKLKREYEREQRLLRGKEVSETVVTEIEKEIAKKQKIAYNLNWYNLDKMYGIKRLW